MNESMIYQQIFIQRLAEIFIEKQIIAIQVIEGKLNRKQVLDFLVSLWSEELKYLIKPYKYKCPIILSMVKNYKKSLLEALGRYFPNTPMLAAIVKVSKIMTDDELLEDMKGSFKHKFAKKPEVIDGNMKALEMALKEVKKIQ